MSSRVLFATVLGLLATSTACDDEEPVTISGCSLASLELVAYEGTGLCASQDPGRDGDGEARTAIARTRGSPAGDLPTLGVGDATAVTVVARCADEAGVVRAWGCDDDEDGSLAIEASPTCHPGGCEPSCGSGAVSWTGGGDALCVATCDECLPGPCATGDPGAHDGCDWTCNDPVAPRLRLTRLAISVPEVLQGDLAETLEGIDFLIEVGADGSARLGNGECENLFEGGAVTRSRCSFLASTETTADYFPSGGGLRIPAEGDVTVLAALPELLGGGSISLHDLVVTARVGSAGNCIGAYEDPWRTDGEMTAKIEADEADEIWIAQADSTLCALLAGSPCDRDPADWPSPPDSTVDGSPAWRLEADIAAIGVLIEP